MLYVLEDPKGRVAVLRLADRGRIWRPEVEDAREAGIPQRARCLHNRVDIHGVPLADVRVVGTSGTCDWADNPDYEWREGDDLDAIDSPAFVYTGHEERAARILLGRSASRGITPWMIKPANWAERLVLADVGLFSFAYECTLETVRELDGYIARPCYPSDNPRSFQRVVDWVYVGAVSLKMHADAKAGRKTRESTIVEVVVEAFERGRAVGNKLNTSVTSDSQGLGDSDRGQ